MGRRQQVTGAIGGIFESPALPGLAVRLRHDRMEVTGGFLRRVESQPICGRDDGQLANNAGGAQVPQLMSQPMWWPEDRLIARPRREPSIEGEATCPRDDQVRASLLVSPPPELDLDVVCADHEHREVQLDPPSCHLLKLAAGSTAIAANRQA